MQEELMEWKPADTTIVSIAEAWEPTYWTRRFQVNGGRLRRARALIGTYPRDLAAYFSGNGRQISWVPVRGSV